MDVITLCLTLRQRHRETAVNISQHTGLGALNANGSTDNRLAVLL